MTGRTAAPAALPYARVVVALCFVSVAVATAVTQSIIILFPQIIADFGWSRTALSVAPALAGAAASGGALLVGFLADRRDLRVLMSAGALVAAAGLLLCSRAAAPWHLYAAFGLVAGLGNSFLGVLPNNLILARWFERGRGAAIGIVSSGFGAGVLVFMPLLQWATRGGRWRAGYLLLAAVLVAYAPLVLLLQRSRPPAPGRADGAAAGAAAAAAAAAEPAPSRRLAALARRPRFWFTYVQFILGPLSTMPVIIHQGALMRDRGVSEMSTAWVVALFGLASFAGMIVSGALSDRMGRERAYTLGTLCLAAGCLALLAGEGRAAGVSAIAYAVLFGFGFGTRPAMDAATAADVFRGPGFGLVYGTLSTGLGLGNLAAPVLAGAVYDVTGSYAAAIVFCVVAVSAATVAIWLAAPRRGLEAA
jgi:MFS family permease